MPTFYRPDPDDEIFSADFVVTSPLPRLTPAPSTEPADDDEERAHGEEEESAT